MSLIVKSSNGRLSYTNTTQSDGGGNTVDSFGPVVLDFSLPNGILAGQADQSYRDYRTLVSAAENYILSGLPNSAAVVKMRVLYINILSALGSGGSLAVAPGATHPWAGCGTHTLLPGSTLLITWLDLAGSPVVASTTDQFTLTATGTILYQMMVAGTSA